jgi:hypothetical protein
MLMHTPMLILESRVSNKPCTNIKALAPLRLFSMRKFCFYCNDQTNHLFHVLNPGCLCRGIPLANCIVTGRQKYYEPM